MLIHSATTCDNPFSSLYLRGVKRVLDVLPRGRRSVFRCCWRLAGSPSRFIGEIAGFPAVIDALDSGTALKQFLWRWYEPQVTAVFLNNLDPALPVVDVGANKGYFSLLALRNLDCNVPCISYEPLPANLADLEATKALGKHDNWLIRAFGLSSTAGQVGFAIDTSGSQSGWGRVDQQGLLRIHIKPLDSELKQLGIERVGLVKMDVEGHELDAMEGMKAALSTGRIGCLMVELHPSQLDQKRYESCLQDMSDWRYEAFWIDERAISPRRCSAALDKGQHQVLAEKLIIPVESSWLPSERRYIVWKLRAETPVRVW